MLWYGVMLGLFPGLPRSKTGAGEGVGTRLGLCNVIAQETTEAMVMQCCCPGDY